MVHSLRRKLSLILVLLLLSLMTVVSVLLVNRVAKFHADAFYQQMQAVFSDQQFYSDLQHAAASEQGPERLQQILEGNAGLLGVDGRTRNYFILDGRTGVCLAGSDEALGQTLHVTPNIITAISGSEGYAGSAASSYLDVAMPLRSGGHAYIIYLLDNRQLDHDLSHALLVALLEALAIGLVISLLLGVLISKTMLPPIRRLTDAAGEIAAGTLPQPLPISSQDEVGVLTQTFNRMVNTLRAASSDSEEEAADPGTGVSRKDSGPPRALVEQASYELRGPLSNVRNYAELLQSDATLSAARREELLSAIVRETDRMSGTARALLELSKVDAKADVLQYSWFPFANVILAVYQANLMEAVRRGHTIHLEVPNDLPLLHADRTGIERALTLVLLSAIRHTPDGGEITISAGRETGTVWMNVTDNGSRGAPKGFVRVLDRIAHGERDDSAALTELRQGLVTAKEIITTGGGTLQWSDRLPKGVSVRISLPVQTPDREGARRGK